MLDSNFPDNIPEQTHTVGDAILASDDVCRFLGDHVTDMLDEADFAELYAATGRPGVHPFILAMVTIFQFLEKLPDRRASDQAVKRLDWKYALRQTLTWTGFHYADLCNFRKRLLAHEASSLIFDKLLGYLDERGLLDKRKQRTDATHVLGYVKRLSRLELKWESLRMALSDLFSHDSRWVLQEVDADLVERYRSSRNSYRMSDAELKAADEQTDQDIATLLKHLGQAEAPDVGELTYVRLLYRVAQDQELCVDPSEFPDWPDALEIELPPGFINSPHEPFSPAF